MATKSSTQKIDVVKSLEPFFNPRSIAVIGASRTPGKIGHEILRNLKMSGFRGDVFPVNPKVKSILDLKAFDRIASIPQTVDLAVIVVPAQKVEQVLRECGEAGVKAVIIITSGFGEVGKADLEKSLVEIARSHGMRLMGPNTFGIFYAKNYMNCTFGQRYILSGKTAFITQSGALGLALMSWTTEEKYGVSAIVSIGNKADVDDADLIEFFGEDTSTKSILIYMEGLKDGRKFYDSSKVVAAKKPIVVIKSGRSKRGALAVTSHTGSIAGQDAIFSVAFNEAGILRADTMTQAFDWIQSINENPIPQGKNLVIVTNGGGIGVLATDKCAQLGMELVDLSEELKEKLRGLVPSFGSLRNPIDLTANADDTLYGKVLDVLLSAEEVHAIIALFCQTANIDPVLVAQAIITAAGSGERKKPLTVGFVGGQMAKAAYDHMLDKHVAAYPTAERAVDGMYSLISRYIRFSGK